MAGWLLIAIIIVAVLIVAGAVAAMMRTRRTAALRDRFGSEYDRTVESRQGRRAAESELHGREKRREELQIRPLPVPTRDRFAAEWVTVQGNFVDQPVSSLVAADGLVASVMRERGYPVEDFAVQSDLISVDHPQVVENYRHAHTVFLRAQNQSATTEELREAMVRYRSLFDELLHDTDNATPQDTSPIASDQELTR
jgi:hypothetical protein